MEVSNCVAAFSSLNVCLLVWCQISDITRSRIVTRANHFGYFSRAVAIFCQISDNFAPVPDGHADVATKPVSYPFIDA
jgi:hypothetical protein